MKKKTAPVETALAVSLTETPDHADLSSVYRELWLHLRHIENQRLTFTSIYMAAYGLSVISLCKGDISNLFLQCALLTFLMLFSYFGMALSTRTLITFWVHYKDIIRLQKKLDPDSFADFGSDSKDIRAFINENEPRYAGLNGFFIRLSGSDNPIPLTLIFPLFYFFGGLLALTIMVVLILAKWPGHIFPAHMSLQFNYRF